MRAGRRALLFAAVLGCGACARAGGVPAEAPATGSGVRATGEGRPPLTAVVRAGDAHGALAVAVSLEGLAPERGAVPAVALAALVEARLSGQDPPVIAVGGWGGWRLQALVQSPARAAALALAVRSAMLAPVTGGDPALPAVRRKVEALAHRPLPDRVLGQVARCTGEAFGFGADVPPSVDELEAWRRAAHGVGRVAFATAGEEAIADAAASSLAAAPEWPEATPAGSLAPGPELAATLYDAASEIPPGAARVIVTARAPGAEQVVACAAALGDPRGPLASRLSALDAPATVHSIVATAHPDGGCLAVTLDMSARDVGADAASRIATAAALARQEITFELADTPPSSGIGHELAVRARDPREAAERAAWWSLAGTVRAASSTLHVGLFVGAAPPRDRPPPGASPPSVIPSEIDRATVAWHAPVVEARSRIEHGQGEAWVLVASPCGTAGEGVADAGEGAVVAMAAALQAVESPGEAHVEPFVTVDGLGVLAHGAALPGESSEAQARRLGDLAARALLADSLAPRHRSVARAALLARATEIDSRLLSAAGGALAPEHPSWVSPAGTAFGLASLSDDDIAVRASALRAGPLRVAVLANEDEAQARAAVRAVDRWIARRPGEVRTCPRTAASQARPGTLAVDLPAGARSAALLALPLALPDDLGRSAARAIASALDGPDGLLPRALGLGGTEGGRPLALSASAAIVGPPGREALALRIVADDTSLDDAVAQSRALLDRLRRGALREEDHARAGQRRARAELAASLDPRERVIDLWRGEAPLPPPTLEGMRALAAASLRDDALVVVAARPPRLPVLPPRETKGHGREPGARGP